jgi:glyoxylase-like metal-dependent hydrolase (beta-lactamase superfamily II)
MDIRIDRIRIGVTGCYLVRHEGTILIDAGNSNQEKRFFSAFEQLGVRPEEIQLILATHGHADHIGSAAKIAEITGAPIAIHQADQEWLEKGILEVPPGVTRWGRIMRSMFMFGAAESFFRFQPAAAGVVFGDEDFALNDFGIPGKVIATPGHSPGSVSVLLDNMDAFVGDQAMNGLPFRTKPGLPILAEDIEEVKESWRKMLKMKLKTIYPGHGKPFPAEVMREAIL